MQGYFNSKEGFRMMLKRLLKMAFEMLENAQRAEIESELRGKRLQKRHEELRKEIHKIKVNTVVLPPTR